MFGNIFNPPWVVKQIDEWLESTHSSERLLNQETIKNTPPIQFDGEVKAVIETQSKAKN